MHIYGLILHIGEGSTEMEHKSGGRKLSSTGPENTIVASCIIILPQNSQKGKKLFPTNLCAVQPDPIGRSNMT